VKTEADYQYEGAPNPFGRVDFVRYDRGTGLIEAWGHCARIDFDNMTLDGQAILAGAGHPDTHRVDLDTLQIVAHADYQDPQMELAL